MAVLFCCDRSVHHDNEQGGPKGLPCTGFELKTHGSSLRADIAARCAFFPETRLRQSSFTNTESPSFRPSASRCITVKELETAETTPGIREPSTLEKMGAES